MLQEFANNVCAGAFGERAQLGKGFLSTEFGNARLGSSWSAEGSGIARRSCAGSKLALGSLAFSATQAVNDAD